MNLNKLNLKKKFLLTLLSLGIVLNSSCQRVVTPNEVKHKDSESKVSSETNITSTTTTTADISEETTTTTTEETSEYTSSTSTSEVNNEEDESDTNLDISDKGTAREPYKIDEVAHFDGSDSLFDLFQAEIIVQEVYRGDKALEMVKSASPLNPNPDPGNEYLVAQVLVHVTASKNNEPVALSNYFFSLASGEKQALYDDTTLLAHITPNLEPLEVGETSIGYVCFEVDKADKNPYIVFLPRANNGLWFYTSEEQASTSRSSLEDNDYSFNY